MTSTYTTGGYADADGFYSPSFDECCNRLSEDPGSPQAWCDFGYACDDRSQSADAFRKAIECSRLIFDANPQARCTESEFDDAICAAIDSAEMLFAGLSKDEGETVIRNLFDRFPCHSEVNKAMFWVLADNGQFDDAISCFIVYDPLVSNHEDAEVAIAAMLFLVASFCAHCGSMMGKWICAKWPEKKLLVKDAMKYLP